MKKEKITNLKALLCLFLTLLCYDLYAQLPAFNLVVTPTPQTCLGNGGLIFTTSGTTTGSQMDYAVYLLPNTTTPITTVTSPSASGLVAGTYQVVATQTLGAQSNTVTATAIIADNVVPLSYTLKTAPCGDNGDITVQVTSGTAQSYEIISGPETRALQDSNVFTGLPLGLYSVRVHDICGDAVVVNVQMQALPVYLWINDKILPDVPLPACNKITVGHAITNNYPMLWPVTLTFKVYPPNGGTPVIITKTINEYSDDQIEYADIPYYPEYYTYDVTMTDACGNTKTINSFINKKFDFELSPKTVSCNNFMLGIDLSTYKLPCTVSFLSSPVGFNPGSFNASHPVFNGDNILYGTNSNPIPLGYYEVKITDGCGNSVIHDITITNNDSPTVNSGIGNESMCYGYFIVTMPFNRNIASAVITSAPDAYDAELPQNVMSFVNNETLKMDDIPAGNYMVVLTDVCGIEYTVQIEILAGFGDPSLSGSILEGCAEDEGSIYLFSYNYRLTSLIITSAPSAYPNPLPYDGSAFIDSLGVFRTNSLPVGDYTVKGIDDCGNEILYQFTITGYQVFNNHIEMIPSCGSFDLRVEYESNNTVFTESFWLQQYDEVTGKWKDPMYGYTYQEGDPLAAGNALPLNNNATNYTLPYSGKFRVMKYSYTYANPVEGDFNFLQDCITQIYEFTYYDNPHINGAYGFSCGNGTSDVIIDAEGFAPLMYEVTSKNGEPFTINNGTLNFFQGLENGTYNFRVTDGCSNFLNIQYDITTLQSISIESPELCDGQAGSLNIQGFSFLNYEWWKNTDPGNILSTSNTLDFETFNSITDGGTYSLHVTTTMPGSCIDEILSIEATSLLPPVAGADNALSICNDGMPLDLNQYLQQPFDANGKWIDTNATGKLQQNMLTTSGLAAGTYNFKYKVTNVCGNSDEALIELTIKPSPEIPLVAIDGPVCEGGNMLLLASSIEGASYNWTGPNGFISNDQNPVLQNISVLSAGVYTLNISIDGTDCPSLPVSITAVVNKTPEFEIGGEKVICQENEVVLLVIPQNFNYNSVGYTWYFNNVILPNTTQSIVVNQPGIYKVIVDNNGCIDEKEVNITENSFSIALEAGCMDGAYVINILSDADLSNAEVLWTGPGDYTYTGIKADITNLRAGEYTVTAAIDGCTAIASVEVENTNCTDIPKGISPNGDTINDIFDLSNFEVTELKIFNRYGLIIYKAGNYKKEWHGQTDNGNEAPTGVYYYTITKATGEQKTGWVYLQR